MKRTLTILTLILAAATVAFGDRYTGAADSVVKVEGTSTLHAWTMQTSIIKGEISAPNPSNWNAPAKAIVTIPVVSLKSEHTKMDKLMAEALKAKTYPEIRYEMVEASPAVADDAKFVLKTRGKLTIAGVTREVAMDVHGTRAADGRYTLTGQTPIRMTNFGIKPPTAMLNTIKTGDDVKVTFRWTVSRSQ